jgi:hypothetical protein
MSFPNGGEAVNFSVVLRSRVLCIEPRLVCRVRFSARNQRRHMFSVENWITPTNQQGELRYPLEDYELNFSTLTM